MQIIDGKAVSASVKAQVEEECEQLKKQGVTPGLAVIIVGDDSASQVYVRNKERACEECGFFSKKKPKMHELLLCAVQPLRGAVCACTISV